MQIERWQNYKDLHEAFGELQFSINDENVAWRKGAKFTFKNEDFSIQKGNCIIVYYSGINKIDICGLSLNELIVISNEDILHTESRSHWNRKTHSFVATNRKAAFGFIKTIILML